MEEGVKMKNGERFKYTFILYLTLSLLLFLVLNFYSDYNNLPHFIPKSIDTAVIPNINHEPDTNETVGCTLPSLKPFDPSILQFLDVPPPVHCSSGFPLLFSTDLNRTLIHHSANLVENGRSYCCYTPFVRLNETNVKFEDTCIPISLVASETKIPDHIEFIRISCSTSSYQPLYVDYFAFVPPPSEFRNRTLKGQENNKKEEARSRDGSKVRRPNVVILGLDAVSHMNFQRTMPLSFKYLTESLKARGMAGFTTNAENTLTNLMPALTGHSIEEIQSMCWSDYTKYFDDCPFIWKNYSSQGYLTAFAEDSVNLGMFRYEKQGFNNQPTDVYHHTLFNHMTNAGACHGTLKWCCGPRLAFDSHLHLIRQMAEVMQKPTHYPYFQFTWVTSLFHDMLNSGKHGDQLLLDTLTWFKEQGHLDKDTIFILMSDHGIRYGRIQNTLQGRLERRMPFLYFLFPPWFVQKYPRAVVNLERNERRLTSHFDLHETLKDLLFLQTITDDQIQERQDELLEEQRKFPAFREQSRVPRGISLFLRIPAERTCKDAGIPEVWCVCKRSESVSVQNSTMVQEAAENIVEEINKKFDAFPECAKLSLKQVWSAQVYHSEGKGIENRNLSDFSFSADPRLSFFISLSTTPGDAQFDAVATFMNRTETWEVEPEIARANKYNGQSACVNDPRMKLFCYCR